jgi:hypothetical protein
MARRRPDLPTKEECKELNLQRELFSTHKIKIGRTSTGTWQGLTWTANTIPTGSWFTIANKTWELTPLLSRSRIAGVRWFLIDRHGNRVRSLFLTPAGAVGSRWELQLLYRCSRLCHDKRRAAWGRKKLIEKLDGPTDYQWVRSHPYYRPKKPRLVRYTTYDSVNLTRTSL